MKVESWDIDKVTPYENNPRKNDEAVQYVANSIKEFGFQQPLVVDSEGVLIVEHTRLRAAQELGLKEVPIVVADNLSPEQAKAYRLADNKTGEKSWWDWGKLNEELEGIDWLDIDMQQFGFKLDDELEPIPDNFDDDSNKDVATATIRFYSFDDYKHCIDDIKQIVDGYGSVSVKMSDADN